MKFLGDVPVARLTLDYLRSLGHDCISIRESLPHTAKDEAIVSLAIEENRVILCFDLDMATIVAQSGKRLPSVVTFRTSRQGGPYIITRMPSVLQELEANAALGLLLVVEDARIRVRRLPILR